MSENPFHFLSDTPCKKCRGRTRYKSTGNCVPCAKAAVSKRRAITLPTVAAVRAEECRQPATEPTYEDLL